MVDLEQRANETNETNQTNQKKSAGIMALEKEVEEDFREQFIQDASDIPLQGRFDHGQGCRQLPPGAGQSRRRTRKVVLKESGISCGKKSGRFGSDDKKLSYDLRTFLPSASCWRGRTSTSAARGS